MRSDHDDSAKLRRLLLLKRYEAPPPGFFDRLPDHILTGILAEANAGEQTWWTRLREHLSWRPALASVCAVAALGFLGWRAGQIGTLGVRPGSAVAREPYAAYQGFPAFDRAAVGGVGGFRFKPVVQSATSSVSALISAPPPEGLFKHRLGTDYVLRASALVPLTNDGP